MHKREVEHRLRGSRAIPSERTVMRFVGIDVGAEQHVVAIIEETGSLLLRPTSVTEDAEG
jgi:hypothetical protein